MIQNSQVLRVHIRAVVALAAVAAGLVALDHFLARTERAELDREARQEYRAGLDVLAAGRTGEAVTHLGRAHSLARDRRDYQLAFAEALEKAGRSEMAERNIRQVLERDSNDGEANLAMARLSARAKPNEATAFYYRAVYGTWPGDSTAKRRAVRVELADYLAKQHLKEDLLAEALRLQPDPESDPAFANHVASLLLSAGSPSRAINAYREVLRFHPGDLASWRGLAEAELQVGDFSRAQMAFSKVIRLAPNDPEAQQQLEFVAKISDMDPTPRRLRSDEKHRRSQALLGAVRELVTACGGEKSPAANSKSSEGSAERVQGAHGEKEFRNEDAEAILSEAERIWAARPTNCPPEPNKNPVPVLMAKISNE
jgi:Flp pilus assembly protein TadD